MQFAVSLKTKISYKSEQEADYGPPRCWKASARRRSLLIVNELFQSNQRGIGNAGSFSAARYNNLHIT